MFNFFKKLKKKKTKSLSPDNTTILKKISEPIIIIQGTKIVFSNPEATKVTGFSAKEFKSKNFLKFAHPRFRKTIAKQYLKRIAGVKGIPKTYEIEIIKKNKKIIPVDISATRIIHKGKAADLVIFHDLSVHKKILSEVKKSQEKYIDLFNNANDLIQSIDINGNIVFVNSAWKRKLGYSNQDLQNLNIFQIIKKTEQPHCAQVFEEIKKGKNINHVKTIFIGKNHQEVIVEGSISVYKEKGKFYTRGIFRDVTKQEEARQKLDESEELYRTLVDTSPYAINIINKNGDISFSNNYAKKEFKIETRKNYNIFDIIGDEYKKIFLEQITNSIKGKTTSFKIKRNSKNLLHKWYHLTLSPITFNFNETPLCTNPTIEGKCSQNHQSLNGSQEVKKVLVVSHNISDIKQAEEKITTMNESLLKQNKEVVKRTIDLSEIKRTLEDKNFELEKSQDLLKEEKDKINHEKNKLSSILESIGEGVFAIDTNKKIFLINQVALKLANIQLKDAIGKPYEEVLDFIFEKNRKKNNLFFFKNKEKTERKYQEPTLLISKEKKEIPVFINSAHISSSSSSCKKPLGQIIVFRDASKEREIDRKKSEFISIASHQLKTPIAAIRWMLELLAKNSANLTKDQKQYVQDTYESVIRMNNLISDLLNVSRIESDRVSIEPVLTDLSRLVKDALKEVTPKFLNKKIKLHFQPGKIQKIKIDPKLIYNTISNLISNAFKYTPKNGKIVIELLTKKPDLVFSIADSGCGIPKTQQTKVFEKFFRASNVQKMGSDGTGLGLYVAKSIVESSGGKIWFESKENQGTTFCFTLPLSGSKARKGEKKLI
jgi:PAS domain S-box-containing protein